MNRDDARRLLLLRRELTSESFSDATIDAWHDALDDRPFDQSRTALIVASRSEKRVTIAHVVEHLPPRTAGRGVDRHATSCICAGRGWIEVEQTGRAGNVYLAWLPCPDGPRTGFTEPNNEPTDADVQRGYDSQARRDALDAMRRIFPTA